MTEIPIGHSKLGASGAERWMNCHGSVSLLEHLALPESDEADYTTEGLAMHAAAAHALENDLEAWELVGETHHTLVMTADLVNPLTDYFDHVRPLMAATNTFGIEFRISSPVHPSFFGTADFWAIAPGLIHPERMALHVDDLKGGIGILVEVAQNPQVKYYAFGVIDTLERQRNYHFDDDMEVVLGIAQPRGFHPEGTVRQWSTTVGEIKRWVHDDLVPHMLATAYDNTLSAGPWCRFCPAKYPCPMLTSLFRAAAVSDPKAGPELLSDPQLGLNYPLIEPVKFYLRALEKEAQRRLEQGRTLDYGERKLKLVYQKANRVWKEGAAELAINRYGADALDLPHEIWAGDRSPQKLLATMPTLTNFIKSPAQLEKLPEAKEWVKQFSYQPKGGMTVALADDPRPGIEVKRLSERYEGVDLGQE